MITSSEINKYIKDIKKQLLYGTKESKQFLRTLKQNISDYVAENQNADMAQITEQFGKPKDIAATFFEQYDKEELKKKINLRRAVVAVAVVVIMALIVAMIGVIALNHREKLDRIIIGEVIELTEYETTTPSAAINSTYIQN